MEEVFLMNNVFFSSNRHDWETPQFLFDSLNDEFHFTLDAAANSQNAKCKRFYTIDDNSLVQDWSNEIVWCNPPYGSSLKKFVKKAYDSDALVVMLIPARTDTIWFHDYILHNPRAEIRFLKGRLKFVGASDRAPFPSMIVIFHYSSRYFSDFLDLDFPF